jgi:hypothetical protein
MNVGYYSHIRGLESWQRYPYPVFGISEVYIQRFIQEVYEYYGELALPSSSKVEIPNKSQYPNPSVSYC